MSDSSERPSLTVLGIWIGSPAKLPPLAREGIFRFLLNLVQSLAEDESLRFEIWCQQINSANVRELFAPLVGRDDVRRRITFCTELSGPAGERRAAAVLSHWARTAVFGFKEFVSRNRKGAVVATAIALLTGIVLYFALMSPGRLSVVVLIALVLAGGAAVVVPVIRAACEDLAIWLWEGFKRTANVLPRVANARSQAQCFLIQNLDIENCLPLNRPKVVCLHDLYTTEFASLFASSSRNRRLRFHGQRAANAAEQLARQGTVFVSNSDHIRRTHALRLIKGLKEERTAVVLLPGPVPKDIRDRLPARDAVLGQFGIATPYLFYATHVRPYKNVLTLLKAIAVLRADGHDLRLVLTGRLTHDPACAEFVETARLTDCVVSTGELSEAQMFAIYRYAALVAVPTLSEGGFPWQALEAMAMDVPVVVSRIPVVLERLSYHGFSPDACGLRLFDPTDERALAASIKEVMARPDEVLAEQAPARRALLAYGWQDVARQYRSILDASVTRSQHV